ncbi:MAG: SAF domain-containing protein [Solirubrobacterales bacterium]
MTRRGRALAFLLLALVAAAVAAAIAEGYGARIARGYGPLRAVVVTSTSLAPGTEIGPEEVGSSLAVRRVPDRFVPPGALASPAEALGLVAGAAIPAGSYLLAAQLHARGRRASLPSRLGRNRRPVEISVSGADALAAGGPRPGGLRVDVVVTSEPSGLGAGHTYVAAAGVPLLALAPGSDGPGPGGMSDATLGLTRGQALRLIEAESFARKVTLLPDP